MQRGGNVADVVVKFHKIFGHLVAGVTSGEQEKVKSENPFSLIGVVARSRFPTPLWELRSVGDVIQWLAPVAALRRPFGA